VCPSHGSKAPQVQRKALERLALAEARSLAERLDIPERLSPGDALRAELRRTVALITAAEGMVEEIDVAALAMMSSLTIDERKHLVRIAAVLSQIAVEDSTAHGFDFAAMTAEERVYVMRSLAENALRRAEEMESRLGNGRSG